MARGNHGHHSSGGSGNTVPQVTGLIATQVAANTVYLSWNAVTSATTYWIYRDQYVPAIVTAINFTDGNLTLGDHVYAIAAVVGGVLGPKSLSVTVTVS